MRSDGSPTARALLAPELVQGGGGSTRDRLADKSRGATRALAHRLLAATEQP